MGSEQCKRDKVLVKMNPPQYANNIEGLLARQQDDRQRLQGTMEAMMAHLTHMMQVLEARNREIVHL